MLIKGCLNGDRSRADHCGVPVTPEELAAEGAAAVRAGAQALHVHPRGGAERLRWDDIRAGLRECELS
ncbi:3-keto-5-aminohexanoate cleavage protein [Kribbella sp. NPDC050281]|uniref:3-keto-5-aminohexanoate cleavage protein n=1 Tax=Kribbella sp. NPDC050281 TaxID=3155515 RepID=UPI0033BFECBC